jgi:prepilin-type N-terminal cleavage/methylation domain-containing protein
MAGVDIANNSPSDAPVERSGMHLRRNPIPRSGFTLIEMLVVIGIIAVLVAMGFLGFRSLVNSQNRNQTKARLHDMQAFLVEYENATALRRQPRWMWIPGTPPSKQLNNFNLWRDSDPLNPGDQPLYAPIGALDDGDPDRTSSQAVVNTAEALREMAQMPAAKKLLSSLNAKSLETINEPGTMTPIFQVILDAWDHPIIFVPASGLASVALADVNDAKNPYVVTSTKTYSQSLITGTATDPVPPNARPFFASAGPDGRFGFFDRNNDGLFDSNDILGGDDNIYSFEN